MKNFRTIAASVLLAFAVLLPAAGPASAVTLQTDLAGRPIHAGTAFGQSWTTSWCTGIAYGRVNNAMVLFTAAHCDNETSPPAYGDVIYASTGEPLGEWFHTATSRSYDLGWIRLYSGNWPPSPYLIYRGECGTSPYCYGGSTSDYWTVNNSAGNANYRCSVVAGEVNSGTSVYENWRTTQSSTTKYKTTSITHIDNAGSHCKMRTSIPRDPNYKHSGAGLVDGNGEVIGIASTANSGYLEFTNFYDALGAIDNEYVYGAYLCTSAMGSDCR